MESLKGKILFMKLANFTMGQWNVFMQAHLIIIQICQIYNNNMKNILIKIDKTDSFEN